VNLFKTIAILCLIFLAPVAIVAQKQFSSSIILSRSDSSVIGHAHIINVNSKIGVTSNQYGKFSIPIKPADTLLISCVGFSPLRIAVAAINPKIYLNRALNKLETYTVLPYKDFKEFKEAFVKLDIRENPKFKLNTSFTLSVEELRSYVPPSLGLLKHRNKDKENYERLLKRDQYELFLATKFNTKIVKQTTLLKEVSQVNDFMEYCDFTNQFIEFSSHYDLVDRILYCFEEYKTLPLADK